MRLAFLLILLLGALMGCVKEAPPEPTLDPPTSTVVSPYTDVDSTYGLDSTQVSQESDTVITGSVEFGSQDRLGIMPEDAGFLLTSTPLLPSYRDPRPPNELNQLDGLTLAYFVVDTDNPNVCENRLKRMGA